ncbi:MAG: polymer-forming cytoskeletal protein [Candidatus Acidiferrum sp.]|jgi:cytoskeletal protein CcmA (bactofilin family)
MWKKEDAKPLGVPEHSSSPSAPPLSPSGSQTAGSHRDASAAPPVSSRAAACISQGIRIKGEITGSEDLFVDGPIEGKLNLTNGSLTVGPNGTVKADVVAREVIVRGRLEGKIQGRERVQLWSTGQVIGEVQTERLAIEDGAVLRGKVETGKPIDKPSNDRGAAVAVAGKSSVPAGTATI